MACIRPIVVVLLALIGTVVGSRRIPDYVSIYRTPIEIRAKSAGAPGAKIALKIGSRLVTTFALTDELASYKTEIVTTDCSHNDDVIIKYINDEFARSAYVESLKIGSDDVRRAEFFLNTGAYTYGAGCGTGLTAEMSCKGIINFGSLSKTPQQITVIAKGQAAWEIVEVTVAEKLVGRFKVEHDFEKFTIQTTEDQGDIKVNFVNDIDESSTVEVDSIQVGNESAPRYARDQAENTGAYDPIEGICTTLPSPKIECPGYINFGSIEITT